jgi:hypothetical protein
MTRAKQLRKSTNVVVKNHVFINRHMTAAQSRAAYEERCRRRTARQRRADASDQQQTTSHPVAGPSGHPPSSSIIDVQPVYPVHQRAAVSGAAASTVASPSTLQPTAPVFNPASSAQLLPGAPSSSPPASDHQLQN